MSVITEQPASIGFCPYNSKRCDEKFCLNCKGKKYVWCSVNDPNVFPNKTNNMRLAACYTVFNGLELLEKSVSQIYPLVDDVIICYQVVSNTGNENPDVERFVLFYFGGKNKVHIIKYTPDLVVNTKENERRKHQLMVDYAKKIGCTHFFLSATDHFYDAKEFVMAKNCVIEHNFDVTFTKMYTYYKNPSWQLTPIEGYCMPFIMKLHPSTQITRVPNYPVHVDPSVQVNTCTKWHLFAEQKIMMHHYSMIRVNIMDKFKNAAASIRWRSGAAEKFAEEFRNYNIDLNPGIEYFQKRKIKIVPNYFNIPHLTDTTM